jgi:hypothetical protein
MTNPITPEWNLQSYTTFIQSVSLTTNPLVNPPPHPLEPLMSSLNLKIKKPRQGNKIYNLPFFKAFPHKSPGITKYDGEIGLEIECEGTHLFDTPIQYWRTHQDGSLRTVKDHPPIEYVLRKPLSREEVSKALVYLNEKLKEAGSSVVESTRTSVHVHLNCQKLTIKQIYQIWCLYAIFEEMLIDFSGSDRKGNLFCLSGKQAEYNVKLLEQAIQQENFNELFSDNLRYTSCNFASLGKFGSLEFRSMRGTVETNLIQFWIDLLMMIKDKALLYDNPREIVQSFLDLGPENFLLGVFNDRPDILQVFLNRSDRQQCMWDGMRMMRDVAFAIRWDKFNPELEKKAEKTKKVMSEIAIPAYMLSGFTVPRLDDGQSLQVSADCWIVGGPGRWYLFNYNWDDNQSAPVHNNRTINIGPREVYRISPEGRFLYVERSLGEHENRPDESEDSPIVETEPLSDFDMYIPPELSDLPELSEQEED